MVAEPAWILKLRDVADMQCVHSNRSSSSQSAVLPGFGGVGISIG
jgi:hypothetical protein